MSKRFLCLILAAAMCIGLFSAAAAESISEALEDPMTAMNAEFRSARKVTSYTIDVRPTRVSGWVNLYWAPSKNAVILGTYKANARLIVLQELTNWFQVEDPETGLIGFIENAPYIERAEKVEIGTISINGVFTLKCGLPDGYEVKPVSEAPDQVVAVISSPDETKPVMTLSVAFDKTYADVERMNDLSTAEFAVLEKTFTDMDPTVEISYGDTGLGTRLLIAKQTEGEQDYIDFLSIYKGYFVEFVMTASATAENRNLTEKQLQMCIDFLTDLDFVPAGPSANVSAASLAGQTLTANLKDYDPETNTVMAELTRPVVLDADALTGLKEGDILTIGQESEEVWMIEKDGEDGSLLINGEILLQPETDGIHAFLFDHEYRETWAALTLRVPENLVFLDGIDPETGEIVEEPTEHTAAEWTAMLAEGGYPDFASENVYITFGDDGELVKVQRFYTPWQ